MEFNLTLFVVFSAAVSGFFYMLIGAFRFSKRGFHGEIHRFDNNGRSNQWTDFVGNHHDNMGISFGDCGDFGGDSGSDS
jgi:hypothetical protein